MVNFSFISEGIDFLMAEVSEAIEKDQNLGRPIPARIQILATLRYLGTAALQSTVADTLGISQSSVSRCITRVCTELVNRIDQFIVWPQDTNAMKAKFFMSRGFPNVVGVIDGSHIRIQEPFRNGNAYINRKHFASLNICAICDADGKFTFASIRWPGSCHDSFILRQTSVWDAFENNQRDGFLLGDSAYPCRKWLMTPFPRPQRLAEQRFNDSLCGTRVKIECSFGRLKKRFRALHDELRVSPEKAPILIAAAMILHNIAIDLNMPDFNDMVDENQPQNGNNPGEENGFEVRSHIAENYFN